MKKQGLATPPPPKKDGIPMGNRPEQYCTYHQVKGHHTDNCYRLRADIERLLQEGKLTQFVKDGRKRDRSPPPRDQPQGKGKEKVDDNPPPPPPKRGTINVIHGGLVSGGEVANAREVYASQVREPAMTGRRPAARPHWGITFSDEDMEHVTFPHDDALVVTLEIAGYDVKRILVDGGSSSDVLFLEALTALGKSRRDLKHVNAPLTGFSGATSYPLGSITLPVVIGTGAKSIVAHVTFLVVDAPGSYNAILGRATINPYGIVPSTVHQKMKFPTPHGIGEVLGDQAASRKCYVNALRRKNQTPASAIMAVTRARDEKSKKTKCWGGLCLRLSRQLLSCGARMKMKKPSTTPVMMRGYQETFTSAESREEAPTHPMPTIYQRLRILEDIEQFPEETLPEYLDRFRCVATLLDLGLTEGEMVRAFMRSLHPRRNRGFEERVIYNNVSTIEELATEAMAFSSSNDVSRILRGHSTASQYPPRIRTDLSAIILPPSPHEHAAVDQAIAERLQAYHDMHGRDTGKQITHSGRSRNSAA